MRIEQQRGEIEALELPRGVFNNRRLSAFVDDFEKRTGVRAAISDVSVHIEPMK